MEPRPAGAGSTGISHPPSIADGKEEASKDKVERKKAAEKKTVMHGIIMPKESWKPIMATWATAKWETKA